MKLDFSAHINDLKGEQHKDSKGDPVTLGSVTIEALNAAFPDEQNLSGADKFKRFRLSEVVYKGGEQDISVDDVVLIKTLIGKAYGPPVVGPVYKILGEE